MEVDAFSAVSTSLAATVEGGLPYKDSVPVTSKSLLSLKLSMSRMDGSLSCPVSWISKLLVWGLEDEPASSCPFTQMLLAWIFASLSFGTFSFPAITRELRLGVSTSRITVVPSSMMTSSPSSGRVPFGQVDSSDHFFALA